MPDGKYCAILQICNHRQPSNKYTNNEFSKLQIHRKWHLLEVIVNLKNESRDHGWHKVIHMVFIFGPSFITSLFFIFLKISLAYSAIANSSTVSVSMSVMTGFSTSLDILKNTKKMSIIIHNNHSTLISGKIPFGSTTTNIYLGVIFLEFYTKI